MTRRLRRWLLANSLLASLLIHGALLGGAAGYIRWQESRLDNAMMIDLRGQSLLARPADPNGGPPVVQPPQPWVMASGRRFAPAPKPDPLSKTAQVAEAAGPACPPPCPEQAGDWVPASATSRKPVWAEGLIGEEDYPRELRQQGKEGRVVAEVLIDASGQVRDVSIVRSSLPQFDAVALEHLRRSRFKPAYDANGEPVPCRLNLPIVFQLN